MPTIPTGRPNYIPKQVAEGKTFPCIIISYLLAAP